MPSSAPSQPSTIATPQRTLVVSVPTPELAAAFAGLEDSVEVIDWDMKGPAPRSVIDLVVPPYLYMDGSTTILGRLAGVTTRLVQGQAIGFNGVADALPAGHTFANAASVHESATAELTLALILAAQRGIPDFVRAAEKGQWSNRFYPGLADCSVLLIGYGGVGVAIESRLLPFEVDVVRVASRARDDASGRIHGIEELSELLPEADIVVLAVPLTDATARLADDAFFARMRDGALFVNIARGGVADTDALLAHTASGRLRAAIDVTDPEPLPDGHPLYAVPGVLISPHVGGATAALAPRMARLLRRQAEALLAGAEPENVVVRN